MGGRQGSSHGPQGPQSSSSRKTSQKVTTEVQLVRISLHQLQADGATVTTITVEIPYLGVTASESSCLKTYLQSAQMMPSTCTYLHFFLMAQNHPGHVNMHSTPFS